MSLSLSVFAFLFIVVISFSLHAMLSLLANKDECICIQLNISHVLRIHSVLRLPLPFCSGGI